MDTIAICHTQWYNNIRRSENWNLFILNKFPLSTHLHRCIIKDDRLRLKHALDLNYYITGALWRKFCFQRIWAHQMTIKHTCGFIQAEYQAIDLNHQARYHLTTAWTLKNIVEVFLNGCGHKKQCKWKMIIYY